MGLSHIYIFRGNLGGLIGNVGSLFQMRPVRQGFCGPVGRHSVSCNLSCSTNVNQRPISHGPSPFFGGYDHGRRTISYRAAIVQSEWIANRPDFLKKLSLCSINLSGVSLSDETLLAYISAQFSQWGIPTEKICFEITETAAIANLSNATKFINELRSRGCSFSLDDFGSGLSSFAYLRNLPVDFLKIDGLFVKDILDDRVDLAMVKSINEVGHIMGKKTIAEFVENEKIFYLLNELGVDYAQGHGIGKAVPLEDLRIIIPFTRTSNEY